MATKKTTKDIKRSKKETNWSVTKTVKKSTSKKTTPKKTYKEEYDKNTLDWINTEGGDKKFREKVVKINKKHGVNLVVLEPGVFDFGVKRVGHKRDGYVVVYDVEKLASALAEDYLKFNDSPENEYHVDGYDFDAAFSDAIEWIDFNTSRSIPYMPPYAPKLVIDNENGRETKY